MDSKMELWIPTKICDFSYFRYEFVNSDPMQKDANGNYYLQFYLDEINEGDSYIVTPNLHISVLTLIGIKNSIGQLGS